VQAFDPVLGSSRSEASGISPDGRLIVGKSGGFGNHATLWDTSLSQTYDLNFDLAAQGLNIGNWILSDAVAITGDNVSGYNIVGTGQDLGGPREGYLITGLHFETVPEPTSLALVGAAAVLFAFKRRCQIKSI
jgi:PEP-CTERM motif